MGSCLKMLLIGVLFCSTTLCFHLILPIFSLRSRPFGVLYLLFSWCGKVVLKYNSIKLLVFGINSLVMNCVSSLKLFFTFFTPIATHDGRNCMLLLNLESLPFASDKSSVLKILDIFFKYLFNSFISLSIMIYYKKFIGHIIIFNIN